MGRPLRDTAPEKIHLITTRTVAAELLLVPDKQLNNILGSVLARYVEKYSIDLFAYCFLSNHYHLLVRAPEGLLPRFMENLNREIAHRVNRILGRNKPLWGRRYDDQTTIEECDATEAMLYIATNPLKHGLIHHPRHWPGLSCYKQLLTESSKDYYFTNYTEYQRAKRRAQNTKTRICIADYQTKHTLKLTPLPAFQNLAPRQRIAVTHRLLEAKTDELTQKHKEAGTSILGRRSILKQPKKGAYPKEMSRSPRPACYTKNPTAARIFRTLAKLKREAYSTASHHFRMGKLDVEFPPHCFKPPLHHIPAVYFLRPNPN